MFENIFEWIATLPIWKISHKNIDAYFVEIGQPVPGGRGEGWAASAPLGKQPSSPRSPTWPASHRESPGPWASGSAVPEHSSVPRREPVASSHPSERNPNRDRSCLLSLLLQMQLTCREMLPKGPFSVPAHTQRDASQRPIFRPRRNTP